MSDRASLRGQQLEVPAELTAAIAAVRNNASPEDWCLATYADSQGFTLQAAGSGTGGAAALAAQLTPSNVYYGLVRTTDTIDASVTVKFVFISFIGAEVSVMRKAKISTFKGTVTETFSPFHAEMLNATSPDEVSAQAVDALVGSTSHGGAVGDVGAAPVGASSAAAASTAIGGRHAARTEVVKLSAAEFSVAAPKAAAVPAEVQESVQAVRSDQDETSWALLGYNEGSTTLKVVGKGSGDAEEMNDLLDETQIMFALCRVTHVIDKSKAVKFALVSWLGERVPPLRKAKLSAVRGDAVAALSPHHVELKSVDKKAEVSASSIMQLL